MAKTTPGLKAALKAVNKLSGQMTKEANADYAVGLSASNAGQRALSKQTRALTRDLLSGQLTQVAGLNKLARQGAAQPGVVARREAATTNRYGSALGQSVASSYKTAAAVAAGTKLKTAASANVGQQMLQTSQRVAGIAKQATAAQKEAAKYALAQALMARNITDSTTIANLTGQLYQTALQSQMSWDLWKRQQDYLAKQEKEAATEGLGGMTTVSTQMANASTTMRGYQTLLSSEDAPDWVKEADGDNDGVLSAQEMVALYTSREGVLNDAEIPAITALARGLTGPGAPTTREGEIQNVITALHQLYPKFHGKKDEITKTITAQLASVYDAAALQDQLNAELGQDIVDYFKTGQLPPSSGVEATSGAQSARQVATQPVNTGVPGAAPSNSVDIAAAGRGLVPMPGKPGHYTDPYRGGEYIASGDAQNVQFIPVSG